MRGSFVFFIIFLLLIWNFKGGGRPSAPKERGGGPFRVLEPLPGEERFFVRLWELTDVGENAEGYFSWKGDALIFQSTRPPYRCDQMFILDLTSGHLRRVSTGRGRTTCGFFLPGDTYILYSSTHHASPECPPRPDYSRGYVWPLYDYDIYIAQRDGSELRPLFQAPGYQAEATVASDGRIVFTSNHEGDIELYVMDPDHRTVHRVTRIPGYDGGAFFSHRGDWIVFRGRHPRGAELKDYLQLLRDHLVRPTRLEIFVIRPDGRDMRQVTHNGGANFAPYFTPNDRYIIYASNMDNPRGRAFDLYVTRLDGRETLRVTHFDGFDAFPMFSPDCRYLVFASNRTARVPGQTNLYLAELTPWARARWCEEP